MKYILLAALCYISTILCAQNVIIEKQKGFKYKRISALDSLNINEPNFNTIELELHIYYTSFVDSSFNSKLLQIIKNKDNSWSGKIYSYYYYNPLNYNYNDCKITSITFNNSWTKSWETIIKSNYLNLPKETDIKKQVNQPLIIITDGENYTVDVLTKKRKRRISYANPKIKYQNCLDEKYSCLELKEFIDFMQLLKKEFPAF